MVENVGPGWATSSLPRVAFSLTLVMGMLLLVMKSYFLSLSTFARPFRDGKFANPAPRAGKGSSRSPVGSITIPGGLSPAQPFGSGWNR